MPERCIPSGQGGPGVFPPTRWSVVVAARDHSDSALETLCRVYWHPLHAFAVRCGHSPEDAKDLTQEFFARLLEKNWLGAADPERGKLRTFLLTAYKRFMMNEWRHAAAKKRGSGQSPCALDTRLSETLPDTNEAAADESFDREWAMTVLSLTIKKMEEEFAAAGKGRDFDVLKGCLTAQHTSLDYSGIAERCGISEGAARVAVHRLRKRFRDAYREEIRQTLPPGADLEDEMRHLAGVLAK